MCRTMGQEGFLVSKRRRATHGQRRARFRFSQSVHASRFAGERLRAAEEDLGHRTGEGAHALVPGQPREGGRYDGLEGLAR